MSFVSYAQNFEDVMLWRALKHVKNGFYIDVGANDPTIDSVTKSFYEAGWHGINIEPLPSHYSDLLKERPRDINLQCAAGAINGEIEIWECDVRGWASASQSVISQHSANGKSGIFHKVPAIKLSDICEQQEVDIIHFLKIDVEGFEKTVIDGMDFSRFRPWILLIEATKPNSTEESYTEWENDVLAASYILAYRDGLNRYYVAEEHSELLKPLTYPPNVFDAFIRHEVLCAHLKTQQAEDKAQHAEAVSNQYLMQLHAVYNSRSWLITKPLREANILLRSTIGGAMRFAVVKGKALARRAPAFKRAVMWALQRSPLLMRLVARFSDTPFNTVRAQQMQIQHFEQLRSTRIMLALSQLPAHSNVGPVTFLEVNDDVR